MALSEPFEVAISNEEEQLATGYPLLPTTSIKQERYEFERKQRSRPDSSIDTRGGFFLDRPLQLDGNHNKIKFTGFQFNNPWLPPNAFKLLNKLKKAPIRERELLRLMGLVAERASVHFQLTNGKFVAMTLHGRVVEVCDTRVGLLKKIQGQKYREQIFVWRIGSNAFSGRI